MDSIERFMTALHRREPDRVPIMEMEVVQKVVDGILPGKTIYDFIEQMDLDAICVLEKIPYQDMKPFVKLDHWGVPRDFQSFIGHFPIPLDGSIKIEADLENFTPPDPHNPLLYENLEKAVDRLKGKKVIVFMMDGPFTVSWLLRRMENLLIDFIKNPEFAERVLGMVREYYIAQAKEAVKRGADVLLDGDDYCGTTGPMMSRKHFVKYVLPGLQAMVDVAHNLGVPYIKHCDGYTWPILDLMVKAGIDAINPIEPNAGMDIREVKLKFGHKVAIAGNVDCSHLLTFGKPDEVRRATIECIRSASPGGGHILCSSNTIHEGVPPENYKAMLEAAHEFGWYPIK